MEDGVLITRWKTKLRKSCFSLSFNSSTFAISNEGFLTEQFWTLHFLLRFRVIYYEHQFWLVIGHFLKCTSLCSHTMSSMNSHHVASSHYSGFTFIASKYSQQLIKAQHPKSTKKLNFNKNHIEYVLQRNKFAR